MCEMSNCCRSATIADPWAPETVSNYQSRRRQADYRPAAKWGIGNSIAEIGGAAEGCFNYSKDAVAGSSDESKTGSTRTGGPSLKTALVREFALGVVSTSEFPIVITIPRVSRIAFVS